MKNKTFGPGDYDAVNSEFNTWYNANKESIDLLDKNVNTEAGQTTIIVTYQNKE